MSRVALTIAAMLVALRPILAVAAEPAKGEMHDARPGPASPDAALPYAAPATPLATPPATGTDRRATTSACPGERDLFLDPKAQTLHVGLKTYPQTLKLADKEVVLTFDDGPEPATTPEILSALERACVHATFFLIGKHAAKYPALARRELYEGHTVGHHSNTHPSFTLRGFDTRSAEEDIDNGIAADDAAIYPDSGDKPSDRPRIPFFRFPGFADTPELLAFLDRRHIAVFGADLWAADWLKMTPDRERQRVLDLLAESRHHNGIILFHDTRRSTAAMLPALLEDLKSRGYTFARLRYQAGAPPVPLTSPNKYWSSETARIIDHLRVPIVHSAHHLDATIEPSLGDDRSPEEAPP